MKEDSKQTHIKLTSHPDPYGPKPNPIHWGASDVETRGPIIATTTNINHRNTIGTHSGSYSVYRALSIVAGTLDPLHKADLTNTSPVETIEANSSWFESNKIVSLDPYGPIRD